MIYVDQIAELAAESIKAASLTPLRARESAPSSHCEAGRRENAIIETRAVAHPRQLDEEGAPAPSWRWLSPMEDSCDHQPDHQ